METKIDVSVIVPTYRREDLVVHAVCSALAQRRVSLEVIVLDDSAEGTASANVSAIRDDRVRYVKRAVPSHGRPAVVRNEGIALARGRYLHFLDDDDHLFDGALATLVHVLDRRPEVGVAFGVVVPFGADDDALARERALFEDAARRARFAQGKLDFAASMLFESPLLVCSAMMIRRDCAQRLGGFDTSLAVCEDLQLFCLAAREYGAAFVDAPILNYRVDQPSITRDLRSTADGGAGVTARAFEAMYASYAQRYGRLELLALKLIARVESSVRRRAREARADDIEVPALWRTAPTR